MYFVFLILLAFIIPPLAVFMKCGLNLHFFLNLLIWSIGIIFAIFFDFPYGALVTACHAVWVIMISDSATMRP